MTPDAVAMALVLVAFALVAAIAFDMGPGDSNGGAHS